MKYTTQFKVGFMNWLIAPFSWSRWTDISIFEYAGSYLLQGKVNNKNNSKKFRITALKNNIGFIQPTFVKMETLIESGLIDNKVKFNQ